MKRALPVDPPFNHEARTAGTCPARDLPLA
jgi:hypothetical protein